MELIYMSVFILGVVSIFGVLLEKRVSERIEEAFELNEQKLVNLSIKLVEKEKDLIEFKREFYSTSGQRTPLDILREEDAVLISGLECVILEIEHDCIRVVQGGTVKKFPLDKPVTLRIDQ